MTTSRTEEVRIDFDVTLPHVRGNHTLRFSSSIGCELQEKTKRFSKTDYFIFLENIPGMTASHAEISPSIFWVGISGDVAFLRVSLPYMWGGTKSEAA